jgi:hypothetical protein
MFCCSVPLDGTQLLRRRQKKNYVCKYHILYTRSHNIITDQGDNGTSHKYVCTHHIHVRMEKLALAKVKYMHHTPF